MEQIKPNEVKYLGGGKTLRAGPAKFKVPTEGAKTLTDLHEMTHVLTQRRRGKGVDSVTNIAEGNSLGHMKGEFDPVTAAAPHAMGLPGGGDENTPGSDIYQIVRNGYSVSASMAAARDICLPAKRHIDALAVALNGNRVMYQGSIDHIIGEVDKGADVEVTLEDKGASKKTTVTGVKEPQLAIPVDLSAAVLQSPRPAGAHGRRHVEGGPSQGYASPLR